MILPLEQALERGIYDISCHDSCEYKQYIDEANDKEVLDFYTNCKVLHIDELNIDTPDGIYVLLWGC